MECDIKKWTGFPEGSRLEALRYVCTVHTYLTSLL